MAKGKSRKNRNSYAPSQSCSNRTELITIIILIIVIMILAISSNASKNAKNVLSSVVELYEDDATDTTLNIQLLSGANAEQLASQLSENCPGFNLSKYYLAQIVRNEAQAADIYLVNPNSGEIECRIVQEGEAGAGGAVTESQRLEQNLLATVNNQPVYLEEVTAVYNNIPENQRTNQSLQQALDQVINQKLLVQNAVQKGFDVNQDEVDSALNTYLTNNGLMLKEFQGQLAEQGQTMDDFRQSLAESILLQKEINSIGADVQDPSEQELRDYYRDNKQSLVMPAQASVRQLLIYANNSNEEENLEEIKSISAEYNGSNICELINAYSEDSESVERCGLYQFRQGQLLPEFEEAVFQSEPGTVNLVQTRLGFHMVKVINVSQARQLEYSEIKDQLQELYMLSKKQEMLDNHIQQLREQAEIKSYID